MVMTPSYSMMVQGLKALLNQSKADVIADLSKTHLDSDVNSALTKWAMLLDNARHDTGSSGLPGPAPQDVGGFITYDIQTNTYHVAVGVSGADLKTLLNTAHDFATIQFDKGTYEIDRIMEINRGNLTLQGSGSGDTIFHANMTAEDSVANYSSATVTGSRAIFEFNGGLSETVTTLQANTLASDRSIQVADASGFKVGDELRIFQANDTEFLRNTPLGDIASNPYVPDSVKNLIINSGSLYGNVPEAGFAVRYPLRSGLTEIERIEGNTIYLKDAVGYDLASGLGQVQKVNPLDNIHISGISITNDLGDPNPGNIDNTLPQWLDTSALRFTYTRGTDVTDVRIVNAPSVGFDARNMYEAHIDGVSILGSHNKGSGANGYGLNLAGTQHSQFDNMVILDTRHAVLFSTWGEEIGNAIHVLQTNRDINYHGSPDHDNLVIVDQVILDYNGAPVPTSFAVVSSIGFGHPYTNPDDNTTLFTYAVGVNRTDVLHATDSGAYLAGNGSFDFLYGGAGNDVLVGGSGNDTLTGGGGADTFVMSNENGNNAPGTDIIMDFNGAEGDRIVFIQQSFALLDKNIHIVQQGDDLAISVTGLVSAVALLHNVSIDQFDPSWIILNTKAYSENPADYNFDYHQLWPEAIIRAIDQPQSFTATVETGEVFASGTGDDKVSGLSQNLFGDALFLGAGKDTLALTDVKITAPAALMPFMHGVDVLDVSAATRIFNITVDDDMIAQSDDHADPEKR